MLKTEFRPLAEGMGQAVAERTILRKKKDGVLENWGDVAERVALGNSLLCTDKREQTKEYELLKKHIASGTLLMSGRHLQHGDKDQPNRNMEIFTNCAATTTSFVEFLLLLNGSGVGRSYDDDLMLINWDNAPNVRCVLSEDHPDFDWSAHESVRDAKHKYGNGKGVMWFKVPDSREGWAKALEIWENSTFQKIHKDKLLILDFSDVRENGAPIGGMQNRPASGPMALMNAFAKASSIKGAGLEKWKQTMYVDHYFAECVLCGGARRSARMSTKYWKDKTILEFIIAKRPIEFDGMKMEDIIEFRNTIDIIPQGFLWSSNNSVMVDAEFWNLLDIKRGSDGYMTDDAQHARKVFKLVSSASYGDGTGEPGFINVDRLVRNNDGIEEAMKLELVRSDKYQVEEESELYMKRIAKRAQQQKYGVLTNPCGEIVLDIKLGGSFCLIADVVPFHAGSLDEAEDAFRAVTRALIRVNTMDSIFNVEVKRTNRIGVGMTGVHEFAWKFFGYGFIDLVNEEKSKDFWMTLSRFNNAVRDEAISYSKKLGMNIPHTMTTVKPAGTTSKLFGLSEGWHLPSMARYVRWVQFRHDDPLINLYKDSGYPTKKLNQYEGTVIVGFPTEPTLSTVLNPDGELLGDRFVTAGEATPEQQYQWVMLGEKYWLEGRTEDGDKHDLDISNQISYTLKYDPDVVDYKHFRDMMMKYQSQVKCCSVMPQEDTSSYEYLPEQSVTKAEYEAIAHAIENSNITEDIGKEHIDCGTGGCPVDFSTGSKEEVMADIKIVA